jgi:hypothetical protein
MMMEAARTSETSVDIQLRTRQYIPEDSELYLIMSTQFLYSELDTTCLWVLIKNVVTNG